MEGSEKGFSLPNPPKAPAAAATGIFFHGENDENDTSQVEIMSKLQNPPKPVTKLFMSPTISSASKAAIPKKRILGERNESSSVSESHTQSTTNYHVSGNSQRDSNTGNSIRSPSRAISPHNCAYITGDEEENKFVADPDQIPYDPWRNNLSPRPKYLRYNPNRRREILSHHEEEGKEKGKEKEEGSGLERSDSFDSQEALFGDDEYIGEVDENSECDDEEEEEMEEFDETRGWSLRGVLEFVLVLVVCFLSTSYLSSMNSDTPSSTQQTLRGVRDCYLNIQRQAFETMAIYGSRIVSEQREKYFYVGLWEIARGEIGDEANESEASEDDILDEMNEVVFKEDVVDTKYEVVNDHEDDLQNEVDNGANDIAQEDGFDGEVDKAGEVLADEDMTDSRYNDADFDNEVDNGKDIVAAVDFDDDMEKIGEVLDDLPQEEATECKEVEGNEMKSEEEKEGFEQSVESSQSEIVNDINLVKVVEGFDHLHEPEILEDLQSVEEVQTPPQDMTFSDEEKIGYKVDGAEKSRFPIAAIVALPIFSITMACVAFLRQLRKAPSTTNVALEPSLKPLQATKEERLSAIPPVIEAEEDRKKFESPAKPLSLMSTMQEGHKELGGTPVPSVKLLGEFVIREECSSIRSSARKNQLNESEESNDILSQRTSQTHTVFFPATPSALDDSITDSMSYGSVIAEKNVVKKEGRKDKETKIIVTTTPVRRSSRIRQRSVMSP